MEALSLLSPRGRWCRPLAAFTLPFGHRLPQEEFNLPVHAAQVGGGPALQFLPEVGRNASAPVEEYSLVGRALYCLNAQ
jgi:hypothetical protein